MIPINSNSKDLKNLNLVIKKQTSKSYRLNTTRDRIRGSIDNISAVEQAIYKILLTDRYKYLIYDWNYGIEVENLIGKPIDYVKPELERRIKEALIVDDRINEVKDFIFSVKNKTELLVTFTAVTIYGNVEIKKEMNI